MFHCNHVITQDFRFFSGNEIKSTFAAFYMLTHVYHWYVNLARTISTNASKCIHISYWFDLAFSGGVCVQQAGTKLDGFEWFVKRTAAAELTR